MHHASQGGYLDRNFGGILIIWDRLFGSWVAETDRPVYGLTKNINTYNPLRVATHEYAAIAKDLKAATSWRERARTGLPGTGLAAAGVRGARDGGPGRPRRPVTEAPCRTGAADTRPGDAA